MKLHLIRHAHTQQDRATESTRWHLSAEGEKQAAVLARQPFWEEVERILLSSEPKTRLTIEPVLARRSLPVAVDSRFDELRRPGWTEDYTAAVQQALAHPELPAGVWEPARQAQKRFLEGIADLCNAHRGETIALVSHGLILSLYRAFLLGQRKVNPDDWRRLDFAAVALVDLATPALLQDFHRVAFE
jgi:broad specificity phosphatase PhoE